MTEPVEPDYGVDISVARSRNSILNQFILASMSFGMLASFATVWRDFAAGIFAANSMINISLVLLLLITWLCRKTVSLNLKAIVLFISYFSIAIKQLFLFGPFYTSALFMGFCCIILVLTLNTRTSIIMAVVMGCAIPVGAYLHIEGYYAITQDFNRLLLSPSTWISYYAIFVLTAFIIILGVGQLRQELNKNFGLLREMVYDLDFANKQLKEENELKNAYAEELRTSSEKFRSLFEGSRDGVLLLDSSAKIVEANQAVIDISGYALSELKEIDIFQLVDERFRKDTMERFEKNILGEFQPGLTEMLITTKDGKSLPVELNSNLIVSDDDVTVLTTVRDISFRKISENEKFNAVLAAEERERERFSKDLHDDLGPVFSTLNLYLQTLSNKETDPSKRDILNTLSNMVDAAVKQVRLIAHNMSPYLLRDAGLIEAVRIHLKRYNEADGMATELIIPEAKIKIHSNAEIALYRVFLELLNNTIKHSGANRIRIQMDCTPSEFLFTYIDNGKGFDPSVGTDGSGIGLKNIENRVGALGGSVRFKYLDHEMAVKIKIPL